MRKMASAGDISPEEYLFLDESTEVPAGITELRTEVDDCAPVSPAMTVEAMTCIKLTAALRRAASVAQPARMTYAGVPGGIDRCTLMLFGLLEAVIAPAAALPIAGSP